MATVSGIAATIEPSAYERHQLPGEHFADVEPGADLRQQPGRQGFGEDGDETGHGERQQRGIGQFVRTGGAVDAAEIGAGGVGHDGCGSILINSGDGLYTKHRHAIYTVMLTEHNPCRSWRACDEAWSGNTVY